MTKYVLYLIKPDKLSVWSTWLEKLDSEHRFEVEQILANEGVLTEAYTVFTIKDIHYCLATELSNPAVTYDASPVSSKHKKLKKECLILVDKGKSVQFVAKS